MQRKHKFWLSSILLWCSVGLLLPTSTVQAATSVQTHVQAKAAVMIDVQTGQLIAQQNAQQALPIASLSKLLTLLVVERAVAKQQLRWGEQVKAQPDEVKLSHNPLYSNVPLDTHQRYSIQQLAAAAMVKSADGATITLAKAAGGDLTHFTKEMQTTAHQVGVKDAQLYNPVGLADGDMGAYQNPRIPDQAENQMSAVSVAKIARQVVNQDAMTVQLAKQPSLAWQGQMVKNTNELLGTVKIGDDQVEIKGLKTGTSDGAGQCLVTLGIVRGRRVITVVLNANNRFQVTKDLYQQALTKMRVQPIHYQAMIKTWHGQPGRVTVATKQAALWVPKGQPQPQGKLVWRTKQRWGWRYQAPLSTKQVVATVNYQGIPSVSGSQVRIALTPTSPVKKTPSWFGLGK
ncbi:MAG: serine hydrolase [Limosilactobacillus sp.]|nr:serine hydrolase [Limosilactobacillus sp.]